MEITHFLKAKTQLLATLALLLICLSNIRAQKLNQDPGHKDYLSISGIKFSSPDGFAIQRKKIVGEVVYVPHEKYDLGIFVAIPDKLVGDEYIQQLSNLVAGHLFPKEKNAYSWKKLDAYEKVSKFEVGGGMFQGFNGQQRVFVQFREIKINGKDVIVGYTFGLGRGDEAKVMFERNYGGNSMPGWYAQAHIIASITGEQYEDINPGTMIISRPIRTN